MSDEVKVKTIEDLTKEYGELCGKLGHDKYAFSVLKEEHEARCEAMIKSMKKINNDAAELKKKEPVDAEIISEEKK